MRRGERAWRLHGLSIVMAFAAATLAACGGDGGEQTDTAAGAQLMPENLVVPASSAMARNDGLVVT